MTKQILAVLETGYRATLEEQDDSALWLLQSLVRNGATASVLLQGNAVNYAVFGQDASGLVFGDHAQTRPPKIERSLRDLIDRGVDVYYLEEDAESYGILSTELVLGLKPTRRAGLPALLDKHEHIWRW